MLHRATIVFPPVGVGAGRDRETALRAGARGQEDGGGDRAESVDREQGAETRPVVRVQRERVVPAVPAETAEERGVDVRAFLLGADRAAQGRPVPARVPQAPAHGLGPAAPVGAGLFVVE